MSDSGGGIDKMETKRITIPTNSEEHAASLTSRGASSEEKASDQSNPRQSTTTEEQAAKKTSTGNGIPSEIGITREERVCVEKGNNNNECNPPIHSKLIDPLGESTTFNETRRESSDVSKVECESFERSEKSAPLANGSKPPVPNFRLEGSSAGDSSVTVGVASISACISLHSSAGHCGSTGGSNSLDNGEQPSSSGPVSMQSSEEMRLSLVSWYSEPDDPSRLIEGCCLALNTYGKEDVEDIVDGSCGSSSSMGHKGMSSVATGSPVCKSESDEIEKENKTPEPDKISIVRGDMDASGNGPFIKSEIINVNNSNKEKGEKAQGAIHDESSCKHEPSVVGNSNKSNTNSAKVDKSVKCTPASSQKSKVQTPDNARKQCSSGGSSGHNSKCQEGGSGRSTECPRCSRRSKSGTTTPATGAQTARNRTPANRRVVQSSKSSNEIKKPIKSILKNDSRGSGSGSDKQSSMDSLGSSGDVGATPTSSRPRGKLSSVLMTRSDSGARARINFNSASSSSSCMPPEDKNVSKLKRIEKYATLRVRKNVRARPLDFSDGETPSTSNGHGSSSKVVGVPGVPSELMSKSMSYLEKSSNKVHISSTQGHSFGESTSASSTLKRAGSLRAKKQVTPQWEPSGNRTSALRMQKMQEAKAKNFSGNSSGSANSGSGDSLHFLPQSGNSAVAGGVSLMSANGSAGPGRMSSVAAKEKHMGAKIFSKLSSALGQTASSNQKRLRQEKWVQTDTTLVNVDLGRVSVSPLPPEIGPENKEQIKNLESLCNRYRNQFMKVQSDYEKAEVRKVELQKQLEEAQNESTEMIEFLKAEKSILAESLTETEVEAKKWKDEMEALKTDYQSRCSSLVRLSEQHKQEAMKSQALLHRLESQSTSVISQLSHQITDSTHNIHQTKLRVTTLTESLLKTYKVPQELLNPTEANQTIKETDLSCSLLLPLISSLSAAFPIVPMDLLSSKSSTGNTGSASTSTTVPSSGVVSPNSTDSGVQSTRKENEQLTPSKSLPSMESSSLQSLNQAILEREAAEKSGLDEIMKPFSLVDGASPDADQVSLKKEIIELNAAIAKLLNVVRVIVIHCDRKVSCVASSILQCLKSIEDDKGGNIAEIAQVQKSLEAWSEKGISGESSSSTSTPQCKPGSTSVAENAPTLVGNGHAHM